MLHARASLAYIFQVFFEHSRRKEEFFTEKTDLGPFLYLFVIFRNIENMYLLPDQDMTNQVGKQKRCLLVVLLPTDAFVPSKHNFGRTATEQSLLLVPVYL